MTTDGPTYTDPTGAGFLRTLFRESRPITEAIARAMVVDEILNGSGSCSAAMSRAMVRRRHKAILNATAVVITK